MNQEEILKALNYIDPAGCSYEEWYQVGMCLKHEGLPMEAWMEWSAKDAARFKPREFSLKWNSFREDSGTPVTGGTLIHMAKLHGYVSPMHDDTALSWTDTVTDNRTDIVAAGYIENREVEPLKLSPSQQLIRYLNTLFQPQDYVGYVVDSVKTTDKNGNVKYIPKNKGNYMRTVSQIVAELEKYGDDFGKTLGDYDPEAGAWIRFNPLDGQGVKNDNVAVFKYALIESDSMELGKQNDIIRQMNLPVAALVFSGRKSLHAIVHIDAKDKNEYRQRVDELYKICEQNHLNLDKQNRNPSRLSRMPGVMRGDKQQFLVDTNIGAAGWDEWIEWYAEQHDDLPEFENAEQWFNEPARIAPELISGILRQGHKMLLSGPSKAGKSFAQIELTIAIAEGMQWFGWQCTQGRVLYVNFELDAESCKQRFRDIYNAMGLTPKNLRNIDIWNLRGKSESLDKLAPRLIRRARKIEPIAVILDPIYKVLTGDENSADQMAKFCGQFDKVCTEVGCSVIYCHHHSKGAQGQKKAMDRSSGSGVFARDPDALLDMIELPIKQELKILLLNRAKLNVIVPYLDNVIKTWRDEVTEDDRRNAAQLMNYARSKLQSFPMAELDRLVTEAVEREEHKTAWRIEGTLREFRKPNDVNLYFDWPVHYLDTEGDLDRLQPNTIDARGIEHERPEKADKEGNKQTKADRERQQLIDAYTFLASTLPPDDDGIVRVRLKDFVENSEELLGKEMSDRTIRRRFYKVEDIFEMKKGIISPVENMNNDDNDS